MIELIQHHQTRGFKHACFFWGFSLATHVFFARWSIGIWEGETIEISPSTMMGDQFMGEDGIVWGQVWATLWRGSCEDCCSVSFLNPIQRALTPAIFIRFTSKMAWYSPDAVAVEDNHETQWTKSWTLQWFWLGSCQASSVSASVKRGQYPSTRTNLGRWCCPFNLVASGEGWEVPYLGLSRLHSSASEKNNID